jgi:AcrR family transcriptional regulator
MQTERQKEILDTALDLISQKGIQGLTIKNLSKKIGISEPAIYRHYENKIEILLKYLICSRKAQVVFLKKQCRVILELFTR